MLYYQHRIRYALVFNKYWEASYLINDELAILTLTQKKRRQSDRCKGCLGEPWKPEWILGDLGSMLGRSVSSLGKGGGGRRGTSGSQRPCFSYLVLWGSCPRQPCRKGHLISGSTGGWDKAWEGVGQAQMGLPISAEHSEGCRGLGLGPGISGSSTGEPFCVSQKSCWAAGRWEEGRGFMREEKD